MGLLCDERVVQGSLAGNGIIAVVKLSYKVGNARDGLYNLQLFLVKRNCYSTLLVCR